MCPESSGSDFNPPAKNNREVPPIIISLKKRHEGLCLENPGLNGSAPWKVFFSRMNLKKWWNFTIFINLDKFGIYI
jgi:hypothetical protein